MNRLFASLALLIAVTGCATHSGGMPSDSMAKPEQTETRLPLFSENPPGALPEGWAPLIILRTKNPTQYELVRNDDKTVLHAHAESSSSGLMHQVDVDPAQQSWLQWEWKINSLLKNADNTKRATEDSPVRIILGFDGDKDTLPFADQILFETAKVVTGHDFPYATLMYIWENNAPVGTIIRSTYSGRIKMMVAESGSHGIGEWRTFSRNIVQDYEKAFGEKPGRLIGVGVLTDTDNTGETAEAWYGDIRLLSEPAAPATAVLPIKTSLSLR